MKIRKDQLERLSMLPRRSVERRLGALCFEFHEPECRALGEEQLREVVREGIRRAEAHGFRSERQVAFYLGLMFQLGSGFDQDPQFPWAEDQLDDPSIGDADARIQAVWSAAMHFLDQSGGTENEHLLAALERIRSFDVATAPAASEPDFERNLGDLLRHFHPEKWDRQGEAATARLIKEGLVLVARHGLEDPGPAVFILCMFVFGSGFDRDPLHPWATDALGDTAGSGAERPRRLHEAAMAQIEIERLASFGGAAA